MLPSPLPKSLTRRSIPLDCNYCGRFASTIINQDGTGACKQCASLFGTCGMCLNSVNCEFQTNPSPLPHQVQQVVRQGNMTMQTVVQNPERVQAFCIPCMCWNSIDNCCNRQSNTCSNYNEYIPPSVN